MIPPIVFSSAGAGSISTLSANGLMFIVTFYFLYVILIIVIFCPFSRTNNLLRKVCQKGRMIVCQRRTAKMTDDIGKTGAYLIGKRMISHSFYRCKCMDNF
ncbi:hypothetical protein BFAG_03512 [Bacteroides fragilis 3_1_12]|uniref:Uncharacterized protein n=1 Tax=Bacteroides fragilis 3_1_12 TaxID=457424 RepID=A0ABN0BPD5_BACFG|nr:hypothetical protein BFAG_03512 [Bacteroides fragilis 3_1_12]